MGRKGSTSADNLSRPNRWSLAMLGVSFMTLMLSRTRRWRALGYRDRPRRVVTPGLALATIGWSLALAVPALAPPATDRLGREIVLVIDVSRSMAATDAWPSRLQSAIAAARGLVEFLARAGGDRVGVVAFAGRGVPVCPVTENLGAVVEALQRLRPGSVQPGGSDLGQGLLVALAILGDGPPDSSRALILLSDGEDHRPNWNEAVAECRRRRIPVHAVAIGDDQGSPLPGSPRGRPILTRRQDDSLRAIAEATDGSFLAVGTSRLDLGAVYRDRIEPLARARLPIRAANPVPVPPTPLIVAGLLGWVVGAVPAIASARRARSRHNRFWGLAGAGLWVSLFAAAPGDPIHLYRQGRIDAALAAYEETLAKDPGNVLARFNSAACLFRLSRFEEARARYEQARAQAGPELRPLVDFALGNTEAALGRYRQALAAYDACLAAPAATARIAEIQSDARANRSAVLAAIGPRAAPPPTPAAPSGGERSAASEPAASRPPIPDPSPPTRARSGSTDPPNGTSPATRLAQATRKIEQSRSRRLITPIDTPLDPERPDW